MATDSASRCITRTLTTTLADTITLTQGYKRIAVTNHSTNTTLNLRTDGTAAVADAKENFVVIGGSQARVFPVQVNSAGATVISIIGSATKYTIEGIE